MEKILSTVKEASERTSLSKRYLRELVNQGEIKYMKKGNKFFISNQSLDHFINENLKGGN